MDYHFSACFRYFYGVLFNLKANTKGLIKDVAAFDVAFGVSKRIPVGLEQEIVIIEHKTATAATGNRQNAPVDMVIDQFLAKPVLIA